MLGNSPCERCEDRVCLETGRPCKAVERMLPSPNAGNLRKGLTPGERDRAFNLADLRKRADRVGWRSAAVCALYYKAGWSMPEIGAAFGVTKQAVSKRIARVSRLLAG